MCRPPYCQLRFCLTLIAVGSLRLDAHADGRQTERGVGRMVDGLRLHGTGDDGLDVEGSQERLSERGRRSKRDGVVDHLAFEAATEVMLRNKAGRKDLSSGYIVPTNARKLPKRYLQSPAVYRVVPSSLGVLRRRLVFLGPLEKVAHVVIFAAHVELGARLGIGRGIVTIAEAQSCSPRKLGDIGLKYSRHHAVALLEFYKCLEQLVYAAAKLAILQLQQREGSEALVEYQVSDALDGAGGAF